MYLSLDLLIFKNSVISRICPFGLTRIIKDLRVMFTYLSHTSGLLHICLFVEKFHVFVSDLLIFKNSVISCICPFGLTRIIKDLKVMFTYLSHTSGLLHICLFVEKFHVFVSDLLIFKNSVISRIRL